MSTNFGLLIDFGILKAATSTNTKPEVEFQYGGRLYFENGNGYISADN